MGDLVRYDAMCHAIANAYAVDEVKDLRDKALAIEMYARQAKNVEAERQACEIRLRAERRWGQLYKAGEKAKGAAQPGVGRSGKMPSQTATPLSEMGVSRDQSSRWQGLAEVDDQTFEEEVAKPGASTTGILNGQKKHPVDLVTPQALWLHGTLKDFRRDGLLDQDPATICDSMMPHMRKDMGELVPLVISWLQGIVPVTEEEELAATFERLAALPYDERVTLARLFAGSLGLMDDDEEGIDRAAE